ncbi:MAG: prolyl oligopeptidase family serine peptidase [Steroidobacteraceae bacterium]
MPIQRTRALGSILLGVLLVACTTLPSVRTSAYPHSARGQISDEFDGTRVADPYRWLEELDAPPTRAWIDAQNNLAIPVLASLPQRRWIRQRLGELFTYERYAVPVKQGGRYFFLRNDGKQNQAALYVAAAAGELGRVLLDPNSIRGDATVSLGSFVPSPDGRKLAYSLSDAGSDWKSWRIRDVDSGVDLPEIIPHTKFTEVSWARDSSGFFYSRYPVDAAGEGDDQKQPVIRFHRLGTAASDDELVFAVTDHPRRVPDGIVTEDGRWLVIALDDGTLANGMLALRLAAPGRIAADAPVPLFTRYDGIQFFLGARRNGEVSELLFRTTAGAPRGSIVAVTLATGLPQTRVVVPESADVLEAAVLAGNELLATYLHDAHALLRRFDRQGELLGELALPGLGSVGAISAHAGDDEAFFAYTDYFTPSQVFRFTPGSGALSVLRKPQLAAATSQYVTEQVFYPSKDGTRIPMFLVHRRDLQRNGKAPVMLYGYGGFDISVTPDFNPATLAWLELGGVYAVANLRGGGEYGTAWHMAGTRERKQNVFDDFIAAADYLVRERYTKPQRIVIRGGSNGGLLVGAALTQRPDLFGAALPDVGVLDMLRYHLASANARLWADDYGVSDNAADFRAQYVYSPYHRALKDAGSEVCYPPTLVTTADHDNRVVPWHSFKFAAALQAAQHCRKPVLIRVETRAGHGAGKPLWMQLDAYADQWAFAAAALNVATP